MLTHNKFWRSGGQFAARDEVIARARNGGNRADLGFDVAVDDVQIVAVRETLQELLHEGALVIK